jgi:hypothetical protein
LLARSEGLTYFLVPVGKERETSAPKTTRGEREGRERGERERGRGAGKREQSQQWQCAITSVVSTTDSSCLLVTRFAGAAKPIPIGLHLSTPLPGVGDFAVSVASLAVSWENCAQRLRQEMSLAERTGGIAQDVQRPLRGVASSRCCESHRQRRSTGGCCRACRRRWQPSRRMSA